MVGRIRVHDASFMPAGPPSANPPRNVAEVTIWTLSGTTWDQQQMSPTWISQHARMWLQSSLDDPDDDPNNRWAVQLRIPAITLLRVIGDEIPEIPDITDDAGPNIGTDFYMWYLIHGVAAGRPMILADSRTAGETTQDNLDNVAFPEPDKWDRFKLTSAAATSGGVAIYWGDIAVQNAHGEGWLIDNNANNTFVARPRNYSTANIPPNGINATFRIANWGSVAGDPHSPDFSSGSWDYVLNASGEKLAVNHTLNIPPIPAGTNPPATSPIAHTAMMNLGVSKSLHQCILVTLSGANINFLNDAIFQNMSFDSASLFAEEAEISVVGLKKGSSPTRDVYLALEKLNMPPRRHTDEGQFLQASMERVIRREGGKGPLADKLQRARSILSDVTGESDDGRKSDDDRKKDQSQRLKRFIKVLSEVDVTEEELDRLFPTVRVHVYHDTGERVARDGTERPVLKEQSSFGVYVYHEGTLEGWETSIQGAQRVEENLYLLKVPTGGTRKIRIVVKAVDERQERLLDEPIEPIEFPPAKDKEFYRKKQGCWYALWKLLGFK
jgi:hypothetical protein